MSGTSSSNDLVSELREEWLELSRQSFDRQEAGIAANLVYRVIDEIERLQTLIRVKDQDYQTLRAAYEKQQPAHEPSALRDALEAIAAPSEEKDFGWWTLTARKALGIATPREVAALRATPPPFPADSWMLMSGPDGFDQRIVKGREAMERAYLEMIFGDLPPALSRVNVEEMESWLTKLRDTGHWAHADGIGPIAYDESFEDGWISVVRLVPTKEVSE